MTTNDNGPGPPGNDDGRPTPGPATTDEPSPSPTPNTAKLTDMPGHQRHEPLTADDLIAGLGLYAIEYGLHHLPVFPLNGKVPFKGSRGVLDATTDITIIASWWGGRYVGANIGGRVPI